MGQACSKNAEIGEIGEIAEIAEIAENAENPENAENAENADAFYGTNMYGNVSEQSEQFVQGRIPIVNQIPRQFGDDEPIDVVRGSSRYMASQLEVMQQKSYNLEENVEIQVKSQGINNQDQTKLALLVSIVTKDVQLGFEEINNRPGVDLICVIDHSGSMAGEKIKLVKRTLKHMLEFFHGNDRLCLIQFDGQCYRLTRLMRVTPENKSKFRIAIHSLQAKGGTNIENGMHMAFSVLKHRRFKNSVTAIFLLSDGVDGGGEERVSWSLNRASINDPFTKITIFGFGNNVCLKVMQEWQFYFVSDLFRFDEYFVEALRGLVSVVAKNMKLSIKPQNTESTKITKAYGYKWEYDSLFQVHTLHQPHLLSGVNKDFIFEMTIPKNKQQVDVVVTLQLDQVDQNNTIRIQRTLQVSSAYKILHEN